MLSSILSAALGTVALLATMTTIILHILLVGPLANRPLVRVGAIVSIFFECLMLVIFIFLFLAQVIRSCKAILNRWSTIFFASSVVISVVAATSSVATLVSLRRNESAESSRNVARVEETNFLVGSGVAVGLCLASQLIFVLVFFVIDRISSLRPTGDSSEEESQRQPTTLSIPHNLKSIRYSRTLEPKTPAVTKEESPIESNPSSESYTRHSTTESIRTSLFQVVRPITSKTRLLSTRTRRSRTSSMESYRERTTSSYSYAHSQDDGFDSWDTSTVDSQHRQMVLDSGSPIPGRFLETIPASPTASRSPSPGCPLDLPSPRLAARRSRSYSPVSMRPRAPFMSEERPSSQASIESHIHPLFRSDSPTPPPMATPGTVVVAAPNAGFVISDRASIRSLHRMRSGSLPCKRSPLSRNGSLENIHAIYAKDEGSPELESRGEIEEEELERKMTPPIPDWILSAGSRTSLTDYQSRKLLKEGILPSPLSS